ncbi:MAG: DNA translocase FtsK 4TM domain-containing protein, partial [Candidatus Zixiibacteriota bacterium]
MRTSSGVSDTRKKEILGILLIALAVFVCLSLFSYDRVSDNQNIKELSGLRSAVKIFSRQFNNQCGPVGAGVSYVILYSLGYSGFFIPLFLVLLGIGCFPKVKLAGVSKKILFAFAFVLVLGMLSSLPAKINQEVIDFPLVTVGGWVAATFAEICWKALGGVGSYVLLVAFLIMLAAMITPFKPSDLILLCKRVLERFLTQGRRWRELRRIHRQRVRREKELKAKEKAREKAKKKAKEESRPVAPVTQIAPSAGEKETVSQIKPARKEKTALKLVRAGEKRTVEGGYRFPPLDLLDDPPDVRALLSE